MNVLRTSANFLLAASVMTAGLASAQEIELKNWSAPPFWMAQSSAAGHSISSALRTSRHALAVPSSPMPFVAVAPCRVADTRGNGFTGEFGPPALDALATRTFTIGGQCGIPTTAQAVSFLFTTVNQTGNGALRAFPVGASIPLAGGAVVAWAATTPGAVIDAAVEPVGGVPGQLNVNLNGPAGTTVDLVLDVNGYYAPTAGSGILSGGPNSAGLLDPFVPLSGYVSGSEELDNVVLSPAACSADFNVRVNAAPGVSASDIVYALRVNAVDTAATCTLLTSATSCTSSTTTPIAVGDLLTLHATSAGTSYGAATHYWVALRCQ